MYKSINIYYFDDRHEIRDVSLDISKAFDKIWKTESEWSKV